MTTSGQRAPLITLRLDDAAGPATRLDARQSDALIEAAIARAELRPVGARRRPRRLAVALAFASLAIGGGATASYVAIKRYVGPLFEIEARPAQVVPPRRPIPQASARSVVSMPVVPATEPPRAPIPAAPSPPMPRPDGLAAASRLRARADWSHAHTAYLHLASASPDGRERMAATLAAATLELEHLGRPDAALRRYERLAATAPPPLAEEAAWGIVECHVRRGDRPAEAHALRRFLARFPASLLRARAEARLDALDAGDGTGDGPGMRLAGAFHPQGLALVGARFSDLVRPFRASSLSPFRRGARCIIPPAHEQHAPHAPPGELDRRRRPTCCCRLPDAHGPGRRRGGRGSPTGGPRQDALPPGRDPGAQGRGRPGGASPLPARGRSAR